MLISHDVLSTALKFVSKDPARGTLQGVFVGRDAEGKPLVKATSGNVALTVQWDENRLPGCPNVDTYAPKGERVLGILRAPGLAKALRALKPWKQDPTSSTLILSEMRQQHGVLELGNLSGPYPAPIRLDCWDVDTFPNLQQVCERQPLKDGRSGLTPDGFATLINVNPHLLAVTGEAMAALGSDGGSLHPSISLDVPTDALAPIIMRADLRFQGQVVTVILMPTR